MTGFRLRVERDGDRVRLITRGGYDWTKRYITEAVRKVRQKRFVLNGEAVILGVDGVSDFNALHVEGRITSAAFWWPLLRQYPLSFFKCRFLDSGRPADSFSWPSVPT